MTYTVASFFSGCGGFDEGFKKKGFDIVFANDSWNDACESFKLNHPDTVVFNKSINKLTEEEMKEAMRKKGVDEITVVIGGPPCQCFTRLNNEFLLKKKQDKRKELFKEYIVKIKLIKPKLVLMENVRDLLVRKDEKGRLYKDLILKAFRKIGYVCYYKVIHIEKFDVPQERKRVIFIATNDKKIAKKLADESRRFPKEKNRILTVQNALVKLERYDDLENGIVTENTPFVLERIKHIPQGGYYENLPDRLKTKKVRNGKLVVVKRYGSYLRRLHPDKPAKTLTNNYIIHPDENRFISNREMAIIHTFNPRYKFYGGTGSVSQQIANAVPPNFAKALAEHALYLLE